MLSRFYLLEASEEEENDLDEPIKLLEVVEGALEVGIEPLGFASDPNLGQSYHLTIIEVSPREFASIGETPVQTMSNTFGSTAIKRLSHQQTLRFLRLKTVRLQD
jgi:hypothetical protein